MLIQKTDILCNIVLREPEERVRSIVDNIEQFYGRIRIIKTDKQGNKRRNKPQYVTVNGGEYWARIINPPKPELKDLQKRINTYLVNNIPLPYYAFGGVKGKDNIRNARFHKGQKYVFQTDLKDFFPRITNRMVYAMFVENGFSHDVASLLTKLTTFQGHLPQGAPTSTTIANLVFVPTGRALQSIADREGLRFTTFVDDVTISSQNDFKAIIPEIMEIIHPNEDSQFKISQGKTTYRSGITNITGVKMLNNSLAVPDNLITKIGAEKNQNTSRYKGMLNYTLRIRKLSKCKRDRKA